MLSEFLDYLYLQVKEGAIYVWGGQGETADERLILKKETSAKNAERAIALMNKRIKAGYKSVRMFDCSGLVVKALIAAGVLKKGYDTTADGLYKNHTTPIKKRELKKGDFVFRVSGKRAYHVGVVVDEAKNVIEAYGRDKGVVKRSINASGSGYWNKFGRPAALAEEIEAQVVISRVLKRVLPNMSGNDVRAVQSVLLKQGYDLTKSGIDGKYGKATAAAVREYQQANGLKVDGKVGKNTAKSMGLTTTL